MRFLPSFRSRKAQAPVEPVQADEPDGALYVVQRSRWDEWDEDPQPARTRQEAPPVPAPAPAETRAPERPRTDSAPQVRDGGVNIWDFVLPEPETLPEDPVDLPPLSPRSGNEGAAEDDGPGSTGETLPGGWLVVVDGPGLGRSLPVPTGSAQIGRGAFQHLRLDFGDETIARTNHALVVFDPDRNEVTLGRVGAGHPVVLNGAPLAGTARLRTGDSIEVGATTLRFVALCDSSFRWGPQARLGKRHGAA